MQHSLEWLLSLQARREGHRQLLDECGSLPLAAFRLAQAKCRTQESPTAVPSRTDLRGAAREILLRTGVDRDIPSTAVLASECEAMGLLVI